MLQISLKEKDYSVYSSSNDSTKKCNDCGPAALMMVSEMRAFDNTDIKVLISENLSNITMTYKNLHRKILQAPGSAKDFKNFVRRIGQEQLS